MSKKIGIVQSSVKVSHLLPTASQVINKHFCTNNTHWTDENWICKWLRFEWILRIQFGLHSTPILFHSTPISFHFHFIPFTFPFHSIYVPISFHWHFHFIPLTFPFHSNFIPFTFHIIFSPSIAEDLKINLYSADMCTQTDSSEMVDVERMTSLLACLCNDLANLRYDSTEMVDVEKMMSLL